MKKLALVFLTLISVDFYAQNLNYRWAHSITANTTVISIGNAIALDAQANVYVTGIFTGTYDFDTGPGIFQMTANGLKDIFIMKLDSAGNFIWAKQIGGAFDDEPFAITTDPSNNVLITGKYTNLVDFDPGPSTYTMTAGTTGYYRPFLCKLTSSGNFVWAKSLGIQGEGRAITTDISGNVYSTGCFSQLNTDFDPGPGIFTLPGSPSVSAYDTYISKLDANGNFMMAVQFNGTLNEQPASIKVDGALNIFVSGTFEGTVDFDPSPAIGTGIFNLTCSGWTDVFVCKLNSTGAFLWAVKMGGANIDQVNETVLDAFGNIYVTGNFQSPSADFDPGPSVYNMGTFSYSYDGYVWKLMANGTFGYAAQFRNLIASGVIEGTGITVNAALEVIVSGRVSTFQNDFDPGPAVYTLPILSGEDIFFCKLNFSGNFVMAMSQVGTSNTDYCFDMAMDGLGCLYTTGMFKGTLDFDPGPGTATISAFGNISSSAFICKLGQNCLGPSPTIGISANPAGPVCAGQSVTLTATGAPFYSWNVGSPDPSIVISPTVTTAYILTGVSSGSCSAAQALIINVANTIGTISPVSQTICALSQVTITASGASSYTWSLGPTTGSVLVVSPAVTSIYTLTATNSNSCSASQTAIVHVINVPLILNPVSQTVCAGNAATLTASGAGTYSWSTGSTNAALVISPGTTSLYTVTGTGNTGPCSITQTATVTVLAVPNISLSTLSQTICAGKSATMIASGGGSYSWNTGSTNTTLVISPTLTTSYTVTGTGLTNSCTANLTTTITVSKCTGINNLSSGTNFLKIYPNPSGGKFFLESEVALVLTIYDALGKIINETRVEGGTSSFDITSYPAGIYLIKGVGDDGFIQMKLLKTD